MELPSKETLLLIRTKTHCYPMDFKETTKGSLTNRKVTIQEQLFDVQNINKVLEKLFGKAKTSFKL